MRKLLIILIKAYQYGISPMFSSHCRYIPTCSSYAITSIERFGVIKGLHLSVKRIAKCHPWGEHGYDPVPPTNKIDNCACHQADLNDQPKSFHSSH